MNTSIAIVGTGLLGRIVAFELARQGHDLVLFDRGNPEASDSCGYAGAGMLAPYSEMEVSEPAIFDLAQDSLGLWQGLLKNLSQKVFFQKAGSLVVAHHRDAGQLKQFTARVTAQVMSKNESGLFLQQLHNHEITQLEPQLEHKFNQAVYLPEEGQVDNRQLLVALANEIKMRNIPWHHHTEAQVGQHFALVNGEKRIFEMVIDCRGLGARHDLPSLRGVRGEIIDVYAPDVAINRPIRLVHPRYAIYVVPRENHRFLIGATTIESDDMRPITVQSALELLSAAFSLHAGFAEASIMETRVNCRPAFPNNVPQFVYQPGLIRLNGLYRHGFLLAPKLAALLIDLLKTGALENRFDFLIKNLHEKSQATAIMRNHKKSEGAVDPISESEVVRKTGKYLTRIKMPTDGVSAPVSTCQPGDRFAPAKTLPALDRQSSIQLVVNGQTVALPENVTVRDALDNLGFAQDSIALALDGSFLARHQWSEQILRSGQSLEIIAPMQGG